MSSLMNDLWTILRWNTQCTKTAYYNILNQNKEWNVELLCILKLLFCFITFLCIKNVLTKNSKIHYLTRCSVITLAIFKVFALSLSNKFYCVFMNNPLSRISNSILPHQHPLELHNDWEKSYRLYKKMHRFIRRFLRYIFFLKHKVHYVFPHQ